MAKFETKFAQKNDAPETTQDAPTAPRVRDANGFELDVWGLPLVGPERAKRLAALGKADPHDDPEAWADGANLSATTTHDVTKEQSNG